MIAVISTVVILILFNILMWFVFLHKFNSFFSTDKYIKETHDAINSMIRDANSNAGRNIELIEEKIKQVKAVTAEAERRVAMLRNELEMKQNSKDFQLQIQSVSEVPKKSKSVNSSRHDSHSAHSVHSKGGTISSRYGVEKSEESQTSLFEEVPEKEKKTVFSVAKDPVNLKKDLKTQVKELSSMGVPVDEIAHITGASVQEVNLLLQFQI